MHQSAFRYRNVGTTGRPMSVLRPRAKSGLIGGGLARVMPIALDRNIVRAAAATKNRFLHSRKPEI